jgi:hypothetical protein
MSLSVSSGAASRDEQLEEVHSAKSVHEPIIELKDVWSKSNRLYTVRYKILTHICFE